MAKLGDFITSRVRSKLLSVFFEKPKEMYYVRELTRMLDEEINAVRRELIHLQSVGVVKQEKRGNRSYYYLNQGYPFFPELLSMVAKSTGLGKTIVKYEGKLGFIKYAFVSQELLRGNPREAEDVDLMIIGDIIMPQLANLISTYEQETGSSVNYSAMTEDEFNYRKERRDPFIQQVLNQPLVVLVGDEIKLHH